MPAGVREAADGVVVFDCVKVNVFGARQPRRLALYPRKQKPSGNLLQDPTQDELHILSVNGYIKRRIKSKDLLKVEQVTELSSREENETAMNIYFREEGKTSSNKRKIIFKDKEAKNYFYEKVIGLNPSLRGDTVAQAATARESIAVEGAMPSASRLGLGHFQKKRNGNNEAYTVWPIKVESRYGFVLNYCAEIHGQNGQIIFKDDSVSGRGDFTLNIKTLRRVDIHCINEKALRLLVSRSIESQKNASTETVVYSDARDAFIDALMNVYFRYLQYPDSQAEEIRSMMINTQWFEVLPTANWLIFEVTRTTSGNRGPRILLLNPDEALLHVMFVEHSAPFFAAADEPEQGISMKDARINIERSVMSDRGVQVRVLPSEEEVQSVENDYGLSFEFKSHGERERFCAYLNQMCWPEPVISTVVPSDCSAAWDLTRECLRARTRRINSGNSATPQRSPDKLHQTADSKFDISKMWAEGYPHASRGIFVGTYNVDSSGPPDDIRRLRMWIPRPHFSDDLAYQETPAIDSSESIPEHIELYVIGLQEIGQQKYRDAWLAAIQEHLNTPPPNMYKKRRVATVSAGSSRSLNTRGEADAYLGSKSSGSSNYVLLNSQFMWQIGLLIFARAECFPEISNISSAYEATGVSLAKNVTGKQLGNKGGVGIGFQWRGATMAFINCHLNARLERVRQRENDYRQILSGLGLDTIAPTPKTKPNEGHSCDVLSQHDFVWVLGDLNYRTTISYDPAIQLHEEGKWTKLRQYDQLLQEISQRRVLHGFEEPPIHFPPTYRWKTDSAEFSNKRSQAPSYTDRILVRALPGIAASIKNWYYGAAHDFYGSDHRPVGSVYTVDLPFPYIGVPRPVIQTNLSPPTFFATTDSNLRHLPHLVFKEVKITKFHGISAPPSMFLGFHASWLPENFDARCSPTIAASGITPEQFSALDDLRQEIKYENRKSSKGKKHRAESSHSSRSRSFSSTKGKDRCISDSADEESDEEEMEDDNSDLAAHVFTDFNCFSISGDVDSLPNMDPSRRRLLKLEARYFFGDTIPAVRSSQWDPRWLRRSHLIIIAQHITPPRRKPLAAGWAVLPLRELCDLCSEAAAGDYSGHNPDMSEEDDIPNYLKADPCPFQVDLILGAQPVATLSGFCAFRSESNMDFDCRNARHARTGAINSSRSVSSDKRSSNSTTGTPEPVAIKTEHNASVAKRPPPPPPRPPTLGDETEQHAEESTDSDSGPEDARRLLERQEVFAVDSVDDSDTDSESSSEYRRTSHNLRRITSTSREQSRDTAEQGTSGNTATADEKTGVWACTDAARPRDMRNEHAPREISKDEGGTDTTAAGVVDDGTLADSSGTLLAPEFRGGTDRPVHVNGSKTDVGEEEQPNSNAEQIPSVSATITSFTGTQRSESGESHLSSEEKSMTRALPQFSASVHFKNFEGSAGFCSELSSENVGEVLEPVRVQFSQLSPHKPTSES
eukprot:gb/GECG01003390.1/.p1 GENE.gb/GECG01003390.1/~~gb/GECG01003390.1/.p1  ORF type:complete len:1464 (+),score=179.86 gb/GECG01003390.1/:1-4392(+)